MNNEYTYFNGVHEKVEDMLKHLDEWGSPTTYPGGTGTLYVNQKKVAEGGIDHTQPIVFSADETADVGIDLATPVVETIGAESKSRFTGKIRKVTVEVK